MMEPIVGSSGAEQRSVPTDAEFKVQFDVLAAALEEATRRYYGSQRATNAVLFALGVLVGGIAGGLIGWAWR